MTETMPTRPKANYLYAAIGLYFIAVGARLLPVPGGPSNLHSPLWVLLCAGVAFFLDGAALAIQTLCPANAAGELPADAPRGLRRRGAFTSPLEQPHDGRLRQRIEMQVEANDGSRGLRLHIQLVGFHRKDCEQI